MRTFVGVGLVGLVFAGVGCSDHPVSTGAAAYWEVAHVEEVEGISSVQEDAAEAFYPNARQFKPTWDLKSDYSEPGKPGVEQGHQTTEGHGASTGEGGTVRSSAMPEPAGPQKAPTKAH